MLSSINHNRSLQLSFRSDGNVEANFFTRDGTEFVTPMVTMKDKLEPIYPGGDYAGPNYALILGCRPLPALTALYKGKLLFIYRLPMVLKMFEE